MSCMPEKSPRKVQLSTTSEVSSMGRCNMYVGPGKTNMSSSVVIKGSMH